jgi:DNA-binding PadR family transcriptional regulator
LAVLSLLEVGPLHPYGMQRLIKLWGKDKVVNVGNRANLYKTIKRLQEAGLIVVRQTERDQQYPERTVYERTDEGRRLAHEWMVDMLARPPATSSPSSRPPSPSPCCWTPNEVLSRARGDAPTALREELGALEARPGDVLGWRARRRGPPG